MKKTTILLLLFTLLILIVACSTLDSDKKSNSNIKDNDIDAINNKSSKDKLIIASMENKPFKSVVDGQLEGPYIDIITKALDNIDYEYEIEIMPWNRVVESIQTGNIDIGFSFFDVPERRKFAYYMEEPIGIYEMTVFALEGSDVAFDGSLNSIKDNSIGLVQSYFYTDEISEGIDNNSLKTEFAIDGPTNIEKLINGRVDLIIEDSVAVHEYLKSNNIDIELIEFDKPMIFNYTYLVFPKSKDYDDLRIKLDLEFKRLKESGEFYEIYESYDLKYFSDDFVDIQKSNPPAKKFFYGSSSTPLSIGVLSNTKPYAYIEDNQLKGIVIELTSEAFDRVGIEYEYRELPFSRMLEELESGILDIGTDIYYNDERSKYMLYPNQPFASYPTVLFKKNDNKFVFDGEISELRGYNIGYIRDYYLGPLEQYKDSTDINLYAENNNMRLLDELINGRFDFIIDIKSTGENTADLSGFSNDISAIEPPLFSDYSYITFSKNEDMEILLSEYQVAIDSMYTDGTIENIFNKYNIDFVDFRSVDIIK